MAQTILSYSISVEGGDLLAKNAQKLVRGDQLKLTRLADELDSFEIVVSTLDGKELDMLSYLESVCLAPFIDDGSVSIDVATVKNVQLSRGKTHSEDITHIYFDVSFDYDEALLREFSGGSGVDGFLPVTDNFYALCLFRCLDYCLPIISQSHLNRYEFEVDIDEDSKGFFDLAFDDKKDYFYNAEAIFNEDFSQCKMRCKIYTDDSEHPFDMELHSCERFLDLINHHRIFNDQEPIFDCEIVA